MRARALPIACSVLIAGFFVACDNASTTPDPKPTTTTQTTASPPKAEPEATAKAKAPPAPSRPRNERPLPAFQGRTLSGQELSISSYIGKRLVIFFFNPEVEESKSVAKAVADVAADRRNHNFEVVGVAVGSSPEEAKAFRAEFGLDFPIIDDERGRIARTLGLRTPVVVLGIDPEGYVTGLAMSMFATKGPDAWKTTAKQIREKLHIAKSDSSNPGELNQLPLAPLFEIPRLDGGEPFRLADTRGKPVVLMFFLHTCGHCHSALEFFKEQLAKLPEDKRPELVGVSVASSASKAAIHNSLDELKLDYFTILVDPADVAKKEFAVFGGVPVIYLIDRSGRIVQRVQGWSGGRDTALLKMQLARIAGVPVPMILNPNGYTGSDVCGVCHTAEYDSWLYTNHAAAYSTLVEHGKERDPECVGCHVVGFDQPGGFSIQDHPKQLEDVGCESCHGRGGPHLSPGFTKENHYEPTCVGCHNPKHSLGFDYATFLPKISHKAVAALTPEERAQLVASRGKPRDVLPKGADFVGSDACKSCHAAEYETWSKQPHAHAGKTLQEAGKADDINCVRCHTTGYDRPGGFPAQASLRQHPDLARVGCESCHGPGADHIAEGAKRVGTIVSLGDKCDSCVILQICGSCHDDANDPGFEFAVEEKIERQRHGTIEPAAGAPPKDSVGIPHPTFPPHAMLPKTGKAAVPVPKPPHPES